VACRQGSQTTIDDDGLWDIQEGYPVAVSGNIWARRMWRKGFKWVHPRKAPSYIRLFSLSVRRFAKCPACKGAKPWVKLASEEAHVSPLDHSVLWENEG
jgi:hypothetical protein